MKNYFSLAQTINSKNNNEKCQQISNNFTQKLIDSTHMAYNIQHKRRWSNSNRLRKSLSKNISSFQREDQIKTTHNLENVLRNKQENKLSGLLKTRQSHFRKLKYMQYYLPSGKICSSTIQSQVKQIQQFQDKKVDLLQVIAQNNSYAFNINNQWFNKKRVLPVKLRAKSHTYFFREPELQNNFKKQITSRILVEIDHQNIVKPKLIQDKNKILKSTRMGKNHLPNQPHIANLKYSQDNQLIQSRERPIYKDRVQKVHQKNISLTNAARITTQSNTIFKKRAYFESEDHFKLSPWRNKAGKEDKQNEWFF